MLDSADLDGIADWIERALVDEKWFSPALGERLLRLEAAIRAATDKPRMPEPGWGEKVTAKLGHEGSRYCFVGIWDGLGGLVWAGEEQVGGACRWDELIDPELAS